MKRLIEFAKTSPKAYLILGAVFFLVFCVWQIKDSWQSHKVNKQDAQIQKKIDEASKNAEASEANSNTAKDSRLEAEGRAAKAQEEKDRAAENSNRTIEPLRKARQRYETSRTSRTADAPDLSDDQLCAELTKRSIPCR